MATTKIWPIKDSLSRVVEYARTPEKTDLHAILHYAADGIKTYAAEAAHATERGDSPMLIYFNLEIAVRYGTYPAIIGQNFWYWVNKNKKRGRNYHDRRY